MEWSEATKQQGDHTNFETDSERSEATGRIQVEEYKVMIKLRQEGASFGE